VGGDCHSPVAAYADSVDRRLRLRAWVDLGNAIRAGAIEIPWPSTVAEARAAGEEVGRRLLNPG